MQQRIEESMEQALRDLTDERTPPTLSSCLRYSLFPGGARVRPRLVVAIAEACDAPCDALVNASAVAVEWLHCASLIQDDMQCFDNAAQRRGRPAVHVAFSPSMGLLASDALIVGSFEIISRAANRSNPTEILCALDLVQALGMHSGARGGLTAGQAWEAEKSIDVDIYQQAKTGSLFAASAAMAALCAGVDTQPWVRTGDLIGSAYQIADDIRDVVGSAETYGKPVGVDAELGRPNQVNEASLHSAVKRLRALIDEVVESVPDCPHREALQVTIAEEARRFIPKEVKRIAA